MAEPLKFEFWEPKQTFQMDLSAGVNMGATLAATYLAAGKSIGEDLREGLIRLGEEQKKQAEEKEIEGLFDNLSAEETWTKNEWMPADRAFPGVIAKHMGEDGKLDKAGAVADIAARLVASQGVSQDEAIRRAQWGIETQEYRIMKPEKRGHWMRQYGGLVARGIPAQQLESYANMVTKDSYFTPGEAEKDLQSQAEQTFAPSEPGWREQQKVVHGQRQDMATLEAQLSKAQIAYQLDRTAENAQTLAGLNAAYEMNMRQWLVGQEQAMQKEEQAFRAGEGNLDRQAAMDRVKAQVEGALAEAQIRASVGGVELDKSDREALQDFQQAAAQFSETGALPRSFVSLDPADFPVMANKEGLTRILGNLGIQSSELSNFGLTFDQQGQVIVQKVSPDGAIIPGGDAQSAKLQVAVNADPTIGATLTAKLLMGAREVSREKLERMARVVMQMDPLSLQLVKMQIARGSQGKPRGVTQPTKPTYPGEPPSYMQRVGGR